MKRLPPKTFNPSLTGTVCSLTLGGVFHQLKRVGASAGDHQFKPCASRDSLQFGLDLGTFSRFLALRSFQEMSGYGSLAIRCKGFYLVLSSSRLFFFSFFFFWSRL